jgi:ABC-type nitrate/sulfonate/bicarbonate transport system substrate-binding protein
MRRIWILIGAALLLPALACVQTHAQERLKISYSSVDAPNANWYIAEDRKLYQKYGLEADLVFIPTSTTNVATLVSGSVKVGNISAFPSPPGTVHLTKAMASRTLITTADFQKSYPFPYVCPTTPKNYLVNNRDTVKRLLMALIEGTYFFKTRKEESKKIFAKYSRQSNEAYLESAYQTIAKLFERVPLATREGMEVQISEALTLARKPGAAIKVDDIVDDRLVVELEKKALSIASTNSGLTSGNSPPWT